MSLPSAHTYARGGGEMSGFFLICLLVFFCVSAGVRHTASQFDIIFALFLSSAAACACVVEAKCMTFASCAHSCFGAYASRTECLCQGGKGARGFRSLRLAPPSHSMHACYYCCSAPLHLSSMLPLLLRRSNSTECASCPPIRTLLQGSGV